MSIKFEFELFENLNPLTRYKNRREIEKIGDKPVKSDGNRKNRFPLFRESPFLFLTGFCRFFPVFAGFVKTSGFGHLRLFSVRRFFKPCLKVTRND